ncbi:DUF6470 family protein [Oceanobacillus sp. J11TS1]|uniref:DUF6470 family protein n=1 Tax=Oceanobacillus sp. J11TS1 TaxID=2807191 RepID=UPI001AFF34CC|nr:DUF6470 family protein [Oceanobacillus sp. J11TS1]GIO23873.1 hypothetical protein J11TS1_24540 [Oceanobacillus sp. J11TS1]
MEIPQIRMNAQQAKIQIHTTPAQLHISQPSGELTIRQPHADVTMRTKQGKLSIDQSQAWEDMNLLSAKKSIAKNAQAGKQAAMQATAKKARQGNELMRIEKNTDPIKSQAIENGFSSQKRLGLTFIPSTFSVKTDYEPSTLDIQVQTHRPIIEGRVNKPVIQYTPGSMETSLSQRAALDIEVVNMKI